MKIEHVMMTATDEMIMTTTSLLMCGGRSCESKYAVSDCRGGQYELSILGKLSSGNQTMAVWRVRDRKTCSPAKRSQTLDFHLNDTSLKSDRLSR